MPIAIYGHPASASHWSGVWDRQDLERLLVVAQHDPLSRYLEAHLPPQGFILEGGCGLGQYVLYLLRRGFAVLGGDFSANALRAHRRAYGGTPLALMDLRALPFGDASLAAHISLGVVEHRAEGPQPFLQEIARTLRPGGVALISVPWVNGLRTVLRPLVERREARKRQVGQGFYQYAYSRGEIRRFLEEAGLRVRHFYPYSPAKGLREFLPRRRPGAAASRPPAPATPGGAPGRRLLYWPPLLALTAHMILAVATKESAARP
jgi:SAM-dependent methyltransferase